MVYKVGTLARKYTSHCKGTELTRGHVCEFVVEYILSGNETYNGIVFGDAKSPKGLIELLNIEDLTTIRDFHIPAWENGRYEDELNVEEMNNVQRMRMTVFTQALEKEIAKKQKVHVEGKQKKIPSLTIGTSRSITATQAAAEQTPTNKHVAEKNERIMGLLSKRLNEVEITEKRGIHPHHKERLYALETILAYIRKHYADNKEVINLTMVEDNIRSQLSTQSKDGRLANVAKEKLEAFNRGINPISSAVRPHVPLKKTEERPSEYKKLKKEAEEIAKEGIKGTAENAKPKP